MPNWEVALHTKIPRLTWILFKTNTVYLASSTPSSVRSSEMRGDLNLRAEVRGPTHEPTNCIKQLYQLYDIRIVVACCRLCLRLQLSVTGLCLNLRNL